MGSSHPIITLRKGIALTEEDVQIGRTCDVVGAARVEEARDGIYIFDEDGFKCAFIHADNILGIAYSKQPAGADANEAVTNILKEAASGLNVQS